MMQGGDNEPEWPPEGTLLAESVRLGIAIEELKAAILKEFPFPWWMLRWMLKIINFLKGE